MSVLVRLLYRMTQSKVKTVFFQNHDDYRYFLRHRIVRREQTIIVPGSGLYADAAREVRLRYPQTDFVLVGYIDSNNPGAYSKHEIEAWQQEGDL